MCLILLSTCIVLFRNQQSQHGSFAGDVATATGMFSDQASWLSPVTELHQSQAAVLPQVQAAVECEQTIASPVCVRDVHGSRDAGTARPHHPATRHKARCGRQCQARGAANVDTDVGKHARINAEIRQRGSARWLKLHHGWYLLSLF